MTTLAKTAAGALPEAEVRRAHAELERRYAAAGGCMARGEDFARALAGTDAACVLEALHRLAEQEVAELDCLADGSLVFYFPRR